MACQAVWQPDEENLVNCEKCGKADAPVHMTDIIDGEKRTRVLCEKCASELGFAIDPKLIQAATAQIQKLIAPLVSGGPQEQEVSLAPPPPSLSCPHCGMTWPEFRKSNRFGCPRDYEVFSQGIDGLLMEVQGHCRHEGTAPQDFEARSLKQDRLDSLRDQMKAAVAREDFESAALLRDQITSLEGRGEGDAASS